MSAWEAKKLEISGMDLNTEIILRQKMALLYVSKCSLENIKTICDASFQKEGGSAPIELQMAA